MLVNLRLLFGLLWRPMNAVQRLRDRAPIAFAIFAAWFAALLYLSIIINLVGAARGGRLSDDFEPSIQTLTETMVSAGMMSVRIVLFIAAIYSPFAILIANLFERRAGFTVVIREEYGSVVSCSLFSLAASLMAPLPVALLIGLQSGRISQELIPGYVLLIVVLPLPIFAALMTITLGVSFRIGWAAAAVTTLVSFLSLLGIPFLIQAASFICASPFLLLLLVFLLRDRIDDFIGTARSRQSLKQNLEAATLNPADASAHYQLGLIYQKRGDLSSAEASFKRAVEIDPQEIDAHYQLGRIARQHHRLDEAIQRFESVLRLDPAHSQHEIWRESGLVYYDAGQYQDSLGMFDRFLDKRPSDAEGRYWRGMTLHKLGRDNEATQEMQYCVESVRTAPAYKYRFDRRWMNLAESFLRERR